MKYKEISYVPPTITRRQSLINIGLFIRLIDSLIVWKDFINEQRPEMSGMEEYLSRRALPDLLTEGLGSITVREFLVKQTETDVKNELEEIEADLVVVADFFLSEQLIEAYMRLCNLFTLIEELDEEEVG